MLAPLSVKPLGPDTPNAAVDCDIVPVALTLSVVAPVVVIDPSFRNMPFAPPLPAVTNTLPPAVSDPMFAPAPEPACKLTSAPLVTLTPALNPPSVPITALAP